MTALWIVCAVCLLALRWRGWAILAALMLLIAWNIGGMLYSMDMVKAGLQPLRFVLTGLGISFLLGAGWAHLRKRHNWARSQPLRYLLEGVALILWGSGSACNLPGLTASRDFAPAHSAWSALGRCGLPWR